MALKLINNKGRFAYKDNSMIFTNVVWLVDEDDTRLYHLIEDDSTNEIEKDVTKYIVDE